MGESQCGQASSVGDESANPAAAQDSIALVEHDGLARSDAKLWLIEVDVNSLPLDADFGAGRFVTVTDLGVATETGGNVRNEPIRAIGIQFLTGQIVVRPQDNASRGRLDGHDKSRRTEGDSQTPPLTDEEVMTAVVPAEHGAGRGDEFARQVVVESTILADKARVIVVGNEADFLAIGFVGDAQAGLAGQLADRR